MRSKIFTLLITVLFLSPILSGQISLEMEPIEANSTITDVTLYRSRAAITRTAILDLQTGGYTLFFRDLPSSAYLDSVQASVGESAKLLSVDTSSRPRTEDNSEIIKEISAEIEDVEKQIDTLNAGQDSLALQITMLKTLIEQASNAKEGPVDLDALENQLEFIGTKMTSLTVDKTTNEKALKELKKTLQNLRQRKQNLSVNRGTQLNAVVDIGVTQPGKVQVQLTYLVNNASWQPTYSIRAKNSGEKITVEYDAELWQRTGENWTDVAMTLSTAQPQQSTTPPMPSPWFVDVYVPPPPTSAGPSGIGGSYSGKARNRDALHMRRAGREMEEMVFMDAAVVEAASASVTVNNDGPAVSFTLPRTITVPSNREDKQTTSLGAFETEAEMFHVAVPMLTDSTFIRSNVTNTSEYILLPGQASIFHGSDYVGKTSLPTIAPNETFPLDLGIDPVVTATRVLLEKEATTTGLFGSGKQTQYEYRVTISNGHAEAVEVRLWDRYPVSRNEEIEITLKDLSSPLSTNQKYVDSEKPMGLLRWDLTIPAQSTGDASFVLSWRVEVARGKDIEMTPLPE
jgi:uncharacterized protein (TIGR02231 family)